MVKISMKKINKTIMLLFLSGLIFSSCSNLLDVSSDRIVTEKENEMQSDSLYSIFGIYSQLQKLADQYVILGELRGDLLEPSSNADLNLQKINNFDFSGDNPYIRSKKDYYAVINNCNYVINNIDTSVVVQGDKAMYKVMAAAKAIRAWTYMQLALNCGNVIYFDKPLLTIDDVFTQYPTMEFNELANKLIADLLPYRDITDLNPGSIGNFSRPDIMFISIPFLLGDLYLWTGQYENAATMYHDLMVSKRCIIYSGYRSYRLVAGSGTSMAFTGVISLAWPNVIYLPNSNADFISVIPATNQYEYHYSLDSLLSLRISTNASSPLPLVKIPALLASKKAIANYDSAVYFHDYYTDGTMVFALDTLGDMRKYDSVTGDEYSLYYGDYPGIDRAVIKYDYINYSSTSGTTAAANVQAKVVSVYRSALLYLHYAEAVNRLGKPNLAMAVLKNGLNRLNMANRNIIPATEAPTPLPDYMNFNPVIFDYNIGIHARGCGQSDKDTTFLVIGQHLALQDSIVYVEDLIIQELAQETAFEGNRFQDLMRIAFRRNDDTYLANKVAAKYMDPAAQTAIRAKLSDRRNWYVNP